MANVLGVSALKVGHPIGVFVLMEGDDFLVHRFWFLTNADAADYSSGLSAPA